MRKYVWRKRDIKSGERKREFDDWEKIKLKTGSGNGLARRTSN